MSSLLLLLASILSSDGRREATITCGTEWTSKALRIEWDRDLRYGCEEWSGYWTKQEIDACFDVRWEQRWGHLGPPEVRVGRGKLGPIQGICPCCCGLGLQELHRMLFDWRQERLDANIYNEWHSRNDWMRSVPEGYKRHVRRLIKQGLFPDGHDGIWVEGKD